MSKYLKYPDKRAQAPTCNMQVPYEEPLLTIEEMRDEYEELKQQLLVDSPEGATHYRKNSDGSKQYFILRDDHHFVWLGVKHGGWSFELPYPHPHQAKMIEINNELTQQLDELFNQLIEAQHESTR